MELTLESIKQAIRYDDQPPYNRVERRLVRHGAPALLPLIRVIVNCRLTRDSEDSLIAFRASNTVERIVKRHPEALTHLLDHKDPAVRAEAAKWIGYNGTHEGYEKLKALVEYDDDVMVIRAAMLTLGRLRDASAESALARNLDSADWSLRAAAVNALADMKSSLLRGRILDLLGDSSIQVRHAAVHAADKIEAYEAVPFLIKIVENDEDLIYNAIVSLGNLRAIDSLNLLVNLIEKSNRSMRILIAEALGHIGSPECLEPLIDLSQDNEPRVRSSACTSLGLFGDPQAKPMLVSLCKDPDEDVRWAAKEALKHLRKAIREG
jgi:HEAT repeat protein